MDEKKFPWEFFQFTLVFPEQLHPFQEHRSSAIAVQKASKLNPSAPYWYTVQKNIKFLFSGFLIA